MEPIPAEDLERLGLNDLALLYHEKKHIGI